MGKLLGHARTMAATLLACVSGVGSYSYAATCVLTPEYSIVTSEQAVDLSAQCDEPFQFVDWQIKDASNVAAAFKSVTGEIQIDQPALVGACTLSTLVNCPAPIKFKTPFLQSDTVSIYQIRLSARKNGTASGGNDVTTTNVPMVAVKPSNAYVAIDSQAASYTTKIDGECGSAANSMHYKMPVTNQCAKGRVILPISARDYFSWTCESPNGGRDTSCNSARGFVVLGLVQGGNGTVKSGSAVQMKLSGSTAQIEFEPSQNYTTQLVYSSCGGSLSGNVFTTGTVTGLDCGVTAQFINAPFSGQCGTNSSNNVGNIVTDSYAWTGTYCSAGTVSGLTNGSTGTPVANGASFTWSCTGNSTPAVACSVDRGYQVTTSVDSSGVQGVGSIESGKNVKHGTQGQFSVSVNSGYQATITPSSSTCGTAVTLTTSGTYTTSSITQAGCSLSAKFAVRTNNDAGQGSGLWLPFEPSTSVAVVDQTGISGAGNVNYLPGCVNNQQTPVNSSSGCALNTTYTGYVGGSPYTISFGSGKIISTRFTAKSASPGYDGDFQLDGPTGDNITDNAYLWISSSATESYEAVSNASCKANSNAHASIYTTLRGTAGRCPLTPGQMYYVHLRIDGTCVNCRYKLYESTDVQ